MENEATTKTPHPDELGIPQLCTLIFAFSTYLSCHEFIATEPPFLSMDYFSVFSAFSVAISFVPLCLSGHESIMQNKPNFLKAKTNAIFFAAKVYENKAPSPDSKKQTQSNPIPPPPSCAGKESRISERNAYPDLSGQHQRSRIQYRESSIFPILPCIHGFITQNKANFKMGNINISIARTKAYAKESASGGNNEQ